MDVAELDEALKVLDSSLSHIKWRLKHSSKRRLEIGHSPFSIFLLVEMISLSALVLDL